MDGRCRRRQRELRFVVWLSIFITIIIAIAVVTATRWSWDTRLFPIVIGIPALLMALYQVIVEFKRWRQSAGPEQAPPAQIMDISIDQSIPKEVVARRTAVALAWIFSLVLAIWLVGFLIATPLFVFFYLRYEARATYPMAVLVAAVTLLFIWGLFDQILHTAWPDAVIFRILGD
jgi:hypothetical protein